MAEPPSSTDVVARLSVAVEHLLGYSPSTGLPFTLPQLLGALVKHKGTFLHINAGSAPMLRIQDELVALGDKALTVNDCRSLVLGGLSPEQRKVLAQGRELDFIHMEGTTGFRFHVYSERCCPAASIRKVRTDIPKLVELGLSGGAVERFLNERQGLMILAGKPRCGKINTFASLVSFINQHRKARIVTVEPMIQFWHQSKESAVIQREIGIDTMSFSHAVRQAVQQDPDILAVGGIPDRETAEVVIQAAAGGHLVVALLDAVSSVRAVDELLSAFYGGDGRMQHLLGNVLRLVVCQHLIGRTDGMGQIPAFEILECTPEVRALVASGQSTGLHQVMRNDQMQTLARHLSRLLEVGMIGMDEALQHVDASELEYEPSYDYAAEPARPTQPALASASAPVDDNTTLMSWL
jgi:twitching motility protein PilT